MKSHCNKKDSSPTCFNGCFTSPFLNQPRAQRDHKISPQKELINATISLVSPNPQFSNHESLPSLSESFSCFNTIYPQYSNTNFADIIREEEYFHLSNLNNVCLDYIGHALFSFTQLQEHASTSSSQYPSVSESTLFSIVFKNVNLKSHLLNGGLESELESSMRERIMKFMNACEDDYSMVFTANQSSAFKLLADAYPFKSNPNLVSVYDFEDEAVEAMIERSRTKGARTFAAELLWPSLEVQSTKLRKMIMSKKKKAGSQGRTQHLKGSGLFVFPLQSKVTGSRYSYMWMNLARENGWHILLDATALGAKDMETLGLSMFQPEFLICSFFKVFGNNPSGFSCLFLKKSIIPMLENSSKNMGIVSLVPFEKPSQDFSSTDEESFRLTSLQLYHASTSVLEGEKHTQSSAEIEPLHEEIKISCKALDHADTLGLVLISSRGKYLINFMINALLSLQQSHAGNFHSLVKIYGPKDEFDRGPVVAFNVFDWKGDKIDPFLVQKLAARNNISLGCGFLKNICFAADLAEEEKWNKMELRGKKKGILVVIASLSFLTNFEDMYRLWVFVARFLDADYLEKERWRYKALNQKTIEV
ncbi:hypothetical protein Leryth_023734 [Lithospermum erythrorhizon]|nr:hypothetical protein Leryth_023734 [Lithospermum erythrorhizon]